MNGPRRRSPLALAAGVVTLASSAPLAQTVGQSEVERLEAIEAPPLPALLERLPAPAELEELLHRILADDQGSRSTAPPAEVEAAAEDARRIGALCSEGRFPLALALAEERLGSARVAHGPAHWKTQEAVALVASLRGIAALDPLAWDDLAEAERLQQRAEARFAEARYDDTLRLSEEALELRLRHLPPGFGPVTQSIEGVACASSVLGDLPRADRLYRLQLALTLDALPVDHPAIGCVLLGLAHVAHQAGDGAELTRRALDLLHSTLGPEGEETAIALVGMATHRERAGDLTRAAALYELAVAALRRTRGESDGHVLSTLLCLAHLHLVGGDYAQAERVTRELLEGLAGPGPDHGDALVGDALQLLAQIQAGRGDLAGARESLESCLDVLVRSLGESHGLVGTCALTLARVSLAQGLHEEAERWLAEAERIWSGALGDRHPNLVVLRMERGALANELGDPEAGEEHLREAWRLAIEIAVPPARLAAVEASLGDCLVLQGRFQEADELLGEALRRTALPEDRAAALATRGIARRQLGDVAGAIQCLEESVRLRRGRLEAIAGGERERALYSLAIHRASTGALLATLHARAGHAVPALEAAEESRGRFLLDLLARSGTDAPPASHDSRAPAGELEHAFAREDQRSPLGREELALLRADSEERRRAGGVRSRAGEAEARSIEVTGVVRPASEPLSGEEIRAALGPDEVLLSYVWTTEEVVVVAVPGTGAGEPCCAHLARSSAEADRLEARVRERDPSLSLAELAPAPASALVQGARRVVILPDGPLATFPFEIAAFPGGSPWLASGPDVVYAPSAAVLVDRRRAARSRPAEADAAPLAVLLADPSFGAQGPGDSGEALAPLPGTRVEALAIARALEAAGYRTELLLGRRASLAELESMETPRVLHIATHGRAAPASRPYGANLALAAPPGGTAEALTLERLLESWSGRLVGCRLVVLSACDTRQEVTLGDSPVALPWGFFFAGATNVVASLWTVEDTASALLMARFHANLLGAPDGGRSAEPVGPAAALREAKLWLRSLSAEDARVRCADLGIQLPPALRGGPSLPAGRFPIDAGDAASPPRPFEAPSSWGAFVLIGGGE